MDLGFGPVPTLPLPEPWSGVTQIGREVDSGLMLMALRDCRLLSWLGVGGEGL